MNAAKRAYREALVLSRRLGDKDLSSVVASAATDLRQAATEQDLALATSKLCQTAGYLRMVTPKRPSDKHRFSSRREIPAVTVERRERTFAVHDRSGITSEQLQKHAQHMKRATQTRKFVPPSPTWLE